MRNGIGCTEYEMVKAAKPVLTVMNNQRYCSGCYFKKVDPKGEAHENAIPSYLSRIKKNAQIVAIRSIQDSNYH